MDVGWDLTLVIATHANFLLWKRTRFFTWYSFFGRRVIISSPFPRHFLPVKAVKWQNAGAGCVIIEFCTNMTQARGSKIRLRAGDATRGNHRVFQCIQIIIDFYRISFCLRSEPVFASLWHRAAFLQAERVGAMWVKEKFLPKSSRIFQRALGETFANYKNNLGKNSPFFWFEKHKLCSFVQQIISQMCHWRSSIKKWQLLKWS